jgi:hypothetical protein
MKKEVTLILLVLTLFAACKKKDKKDEPNATTPTPTPVSYEISARINGVEEHCNSCYSAVYSGGYRDCVLNLNSSAEQVWITWDSVPVVGTYTLHAYGRPSVSYQKNSSFYNAVNGTLNLTSVATSTYGDVNQMTATFNFKTDTLNGQFFSITEGNVNAKK